MRYIKHALLVVGFKYVANSLYKEELERRRWVEEYRQSKRHQ